MTMLYPNGRVIAAVIARAVPLTAESPHLCLGSVTVTEPTQHLTLMAAADQWGLCGNDDLAAPSAAARPARSSGSPVGPIPSQRFVARGGMTTAEETANPWSSHGPEADDISAQFDRLAVGLEGRARQLLGRCTTDVAID
jgi:hypothetical protein